MTHVVVLIPGIMGSVLKLGNEIIWPGPVGSLVLPYRKIMNSGVAALAVFAYLEGHGCTRHQPRSNRRSLTGG